MKVQVTNTVEVHLHDWADDFDVDPEDVYADVQAVMAEIVRDHITNRHLLEYDESIRMYRRSAEYEKRAPVIHRGQL